jgi:hypothetical protein
MIGTESGGKCKQKLEVFDARPGFIAGLLLCLLETSDAAVSGNGAKQLPVAVVAFLLPTRH